MNKVFAAFITILSLTACKKDNGTPSKTGINLSITANNTYDYDDIKVSFKGVEYLTSDAGATWMPLPLVDTSSTSTGFINIHTILHGNATDLSNAELPVGHIISFRLKVGPAASVSRQGVVYPLSIPDEYQQTGVVIPADYSITSGKIKTIVIVYNTNRSIVASSNNTFAFKPDFRSFDPSVCGNIEGYIKPDGAMPYITVYKDSTSLTNATSKFNEVTIPYTGGYYKMTGIPAGKYNVKMSAVKAGYISQEVLNVGVVKGQTNPIGTFTLKN